MTEKNRATLRTFNDRGAVARLLHLPGRIVPAIAAQPEIKKTDSVRPQLALANEILTKAPMWSGSLVSIDLDRHLIRVGQGARARYHLHIPAGEVKNGVELEFPLPDETVRPLQFQREPTRPKLQRRPRLPTAA